jgi:hypothetical protein
MSEERLRILNMVASGKITPDEAEKLLYALNEEHGESSSSAMPKNPKFIRVKVSGNDNVDIRVPINILRTGIKLTALIPPQAMSHIEERMKEKGLNFDLSHIRKEDIDELIANLADMEIDVKSRNGDNVKVFCE